MSANVQLLGRLKSSFSNGIPQLKHSKSNLNKMPLNHNLYTLNLVLFKKSLALNLLDLFTLTENYDPNSQLKALMHCLGHQQHYYYISSLPPTPLKYYNICIMVGEKEGERNTSKSSTAGEIFTGVFYIT